MEYSDVGGYCFPQRKKDCPDNVWTILFTIFCGRCLQNPRLKRAALRTIFSFQTGGAGELRLRGTVSLTARPGRSSLPARIPPRLPRSFQGMSFSEQEKS